MSLSGEPGEPHSASDVNTLHRYPFREEIWRTKHWLASGKRKSYASILTFDKSAPATQMARRHADHQPPDPALAHRGELAGHDLDMPAHREADASVELEKSTRRKARKIAPDQRGALFAGAISSSAVDRPELQRACALPKVTHNRDRKGSAARCLGSCSIWHLRGAASASNTIRLAWLMHGRWEPNRRTR